MKNILFIFITLTMSCNKNVESYIGTYQCECNDEYHMNTEIIITKSKDKKNNLLLSSEIESLYPEVYIYLDIKGGFKSHERQRISGRFSKDKIDITFDFLEPIHCTGFLK